MLGGYSDALNYIAALRVDCDGNDEWGIVAYTVDHTADYLSGKEILDGPNGTPIGTMVGMDEMPAGAPPGPSISPPMIDSVGNIWFISTVNLWGEDGQPGGDDDDLDSALIRAVYLPNFARRSRLGVGAGAGTGQHVHRVELRLAVDHQLHEHREPGRGNKLRDGLVG